MRSNKIDNLDLFTRSANNSFSKHIKTQSNRALEIIDKSINWNKLVKPMEAVINRSDRVRKPFPLLLIVKCFILQTIYGLSAPRLEEEIADRRSFQLFLGLTSVAIPFRMKLRSVAIVNCLPSMGLIANCSKPSIRNSSVPVYCWRKAL